MTRKRIDPAARRGLALLLTLLLTLAALPAQAATPLQDCHRVTLTRADTTQKNGSIIRIWTADTALDSVDEELSAITREMADRIGPTLPQAANKTSGNSRVDVEIRYSRTGLTWMSFLVQARTTYHRLLVGQEIVSRTYDMTTGERILLTDIFPDDSEAWLLLSDAVYSQLEAYWPDETPDYEALDRLASREGLEQIDFTLHGMSLVLHVPTAKVYPAHAERDATLMSVTLMYPEIRSYMSSDAWRETDNLTYYDTAAITFDDGPSRTNTTNVIQNMMEVGCVGTFFVIGNLVAESRDLVQRELDEGHSVGYHNWHHGNASKSSADALRAMVDKCDAVLLECAGTVARYDRVPYGLWPQMVKAKVGWPYIQWSLDTYDWRGRSTEVVMKAVRNQISDGDIILCHDIKDNTPNSAREICKYLMEQGYMLLTIDELFAKDGVVLEPDTVYYRCVDGDTSIKQ